MRHVASLLLLALALFGACGHGGQMERTLQVLDSLAENDPDSALRLIPSIPADQLGQEQRMRVELLKGKAMNKAYEDFTTDSVMLEVADFIY